MTNASQIKRLLAEHAGPQPKPEYMSLHLSIDAWEELQRQTERRAYKGRGPGQGASAYLEALFIANPEVSSWHDTRPDDLREADLYRLQHDLLPMWFMDDKRGVNYLSARRLRADVVGNILPVLLALSDHFGIKSRTRSSLTNMHAVATANCVLEAIFLEHLTPSEEVPLCEKPRSEKNAIAYFTRKRRDASELRNENKTWL